MFCCIIKCPDLRLPRNVTLPWPCIFITSKLCVSFWSWSFSTVTVLFSYFFDTFVAYCTRFPLFILHCLLLCLNIMQARTALLNHVALFIVCVMFSCFYSCFVRPRSIWHSYSLSLSDRTMRLAQIAQWIKLFCINVSPITCYWLPLQKGHYQPTASAISPYHCH